MILIAVLNAILAVGVIAMVVTPLVWAILTQHRDHSLTAAAEGVTPRTPQAPERRRAQRPQYKPVMGRI